MIAYKTVLRAEIGGYKSINRARSGKVDPWYLGVTRTAPGGNNEHNNYLFAYLSIDRALAYATNNAPAGDVALLQCDVTGEDRENKLFCTSIRPIKEIPIRRVQGSVRDFRPCNVAGHVAPIELVDGTQAPRVTGDRYHWVSNGGSVWRGRSAPGWPHYKTYHYQNSTRRCYVGRNWAPLEIDRDAIYSRD